MSDYFDQEELETYYEAQRVDYNDGILDVLMNAEMIDIFKRKMSFYGTTEYFPIMMMDGSDGIAGSYGAAGGLIAGLLFGYPAESSVSMVKQNLAFWR